MTETPSTEPKAIVKSDDHETAIEIGKLFFEWRDYTPIPLILLLIIFARPTAFSATLGLAAIVLGELIRIYSVAFIGSISRTRSDNLGAQLISSGPFAYVRNPLYVGNFFIATGVSVFGGLPWLAALTVLAFCVQYYYIVKYEENLLRQRFGTAYHEFCDRVPAWIPRKSIDLANFEWPDTFVPALKSEKRTLTAIAAVIIVLLFRSTF